jgi:5-formyltetrahydrofolate cyclo-ligase
MRRPAADSASSYLSKKQTHKFRIYSVFYDCQQMARAIPSQEHDMDMGHSHCWNGAMSIWSVTVM